MAVHGATPNKIIPAMYSLAVCASTISAKKTLKNNQPKAAIVKGFINQLITKVKKIPLGFLPTSLMEVKSTCTIIG